jgi:hypothetical protein
MAMARKHFPKRTSSVQLVYVYFFLSAAGIPARTGISPKAYVMVYTYSLKLGNDVVCKVVTSANMICIATTESL